MAHSKVGIWLDHREAALVEISDKGISTRFIQSGVEEHIDEKRGSRSKTPYGPQGVFAEDKADRRSQNLLNQYYSEVASGVNNAESLYIFGPAEAKQEFAKYLDQHQNHKPAKVEVESADKMTETQIIETVKKHFRYKPDLF
ncbi:hypothetical protein [Kangiella aquimarina]|uniref:Host attachment protein n=1 Tax=Kangiella aquimarina TaxID=261965 RepID=A0ABZ0X728_9GAMM|nr:hypothetical protein [Kangiella aquimarina]WQG86383.1 hypothetical protein SR900_05710 [Kangiella aquimarina]